MAGLEPRLGEQSLRRPPSSAARSVARGPSRGLSRSGSPRALLGRGSLAGRCPSLRPRRAGKGGRGTAVAAVTLDARRALLADLLSYGGSSGRPPRSRGGGVLRRVASAGA